MTALSPFLVLLLALTLLSPAFAQGGGEARADAANARANAGTDRADARVGAAAFRADIARNKGERIDGEFIIQFSGDCRSRCRGELQRSINSNAETRGCSVGKRQIQIGDVRFVNVKCPRGRNLRKTEISRAVTPASRAPDVPQIDLVEEDFVVTIDSTPTSLWGVDETDGGVTQSGGNPVRDGMRTCSSNSNNGQDVDVWILDTGCSPTFGGKCFGYYGGSTPCFDGNGHGNHVGGTATDGLYGVAPSARKNCVKVLADNGSGSYFIAISAIEYVVNNKGPNGNIINFSLSGPFYAPLNNAVLAAANQGIYFTLAAGNTAQTVCNLSPGSVVHSKVFTIQAHDEFLNAPWWTNYASASADCTDLSAPGVDITSFGFVGTATVSGTSFASPHVAGAIALLISDNRQPTLAELTANGVSIAPGGNALSKPSLGLACT